MVEEYVPIILPVIAKFELLKALEQTDDEDADVDVDEDVDVDGVVVPVVELTHPDCSFIFVF
jgi:hypothetical protein